MKKIKSSDIKPFSKFIRIVCSILCIALFVYQMSICNYFYGTKLGLAWLAWIIADLSMLAVFMITLLVSFRSFENGDSSKKLYLGCITWFLYAFILSIKFGILYGPHLGIVYEMEPSEKIGPAYIQTALALSSIVFLCLVSTHHDAMPGSSRSDYINDISGTVTFDILDTVNFLDVLFLYKSHVILDFYLKLAILITSLVNFMLPTILLITLTKTDFGKSRFVHRFEYIYKFFYLIIVNLPMLIIRSIITHNGSSLSSIFIMKNIISVVVGMKKLIEHFISKPHAGAEDSVSLQNMP